MLQCDDFCIMAESFGGVDVVREDSKPHRGRAAALVLATLCGGACGATYAGEPADDALRLEARGLALLHEHYRFERELASADAGRLNVFVSVPAGGAFALDEVALVIDGQVVVRHRYAAGDLARLAAGAVQPLYAGPLAPGEHSVRLEAKARHGRVAPMTPFTVVKRERPGFIEFRVVGEAQRQIRAQAW